MKFFSIALVSVFAAALSVSATECSRSQFSHSSSKTGDCCLPNGGQSNPPSPPSDKSCPEKFQWHDNFECCVPTTPSAPTTPSCPSGPWDHDNQCCHTPTPPSPPTHSRGVSQKRSEAHVNKLASRNWRSKTLSCPSGETVCNVSNGLTKGNTWACVNTMKDVNFCGGCGSRSDQGMDCSAIPNVWNTACNMGECQVLTCEPGFRVSSNAHKCIAMD